MKLLLIEDDADDRLLMRTMLSEAKEKMGRIELFETELLQKGITYLSQGGWDIVLLDLILPDSQGIETFERIHAKAPQVPIVILSGLDDETLAVRAVQEGAQDYIVKGEITPKGIARAIRHAIERKKFAVRTSELRNLAAHLESVREEERTSLAREIHDELGQEMTGLKMDLSWLEKRIAEGVAPPLNKTLSERIRSMSDLIDTTIQSVRKISSELRPGVLDDLGLAAAIEWQALEFQKRTGIQCLYDSGLEEIDLSRDHATAVFRVCQELLTNVARHAGAAKVEIKLYGRGKDIFLEVKDNGKGIGSSEIDNSKSLGLLGMRERALLLGGELNLEGNSNGTKAVLRIPK